MPTCYHSALVIYMCSIKDIIIIISYECLVEQNKALPYKINEYLVNCQISNLTKHPLVFWVQIYKLV